MSWMSGAPCRVGAGLHSCAPLPHLYAVAQYHTGMAMSWALANLKPGVGKSSTGIFLGQAFYEMGYRVLLIDADKGKSSLAAYNRAELKWPVVPMADTNLHRKIPSIDQGVDIVILDVPQVEDHARIARGALLYADTWLLPLAPSKWEVDRMLEPPAEEPDDSERRAIKEFLDEIQGMRDTPADVAVSLNRTNLARATKSGPDSEVREKMEQEGFDVLDTVIPFHDLIFRQNDRVRTPGSNARRLAVELLDRRKERLG